jgi:2-methylcitrate dehydratase PrpD
MIAIKEARHLIAFNPYTEWSKTLADLVVALERDKPFELDRLYAMDLETFELATRIIEEWRLDRYYANKSKLVDLSLEAQKLIAQ